MAKNSLGSRGLRRKPLRVPPSSWQFGAVIGQRRAFLGWSQDEAVEKIRAAGRDTFARQTLSGLESGKKPSASYDTVCAIADAYGLDRIALWKLAKGESGVPSQPVAGQASVAVAGVPVAALNADLSPTAENPYPSPPFAAAPPLRRDVPILGSHYIQGKRAMILSEKPVDYAVRPLGIDRATQVFAFRNPDEFMMPAIRMGSLLYADEGRPTSPGDDVLLDLAGSEDEPGFQLVRRLVSADEDQIIVKHFSFDEETEAYRRVLNTYQRSAVKRLVHILTVNELLGFF